MRRAGGLAVGRNRASPPGPTRSIARSRYLHRYATITADDRAQLAAWQFPVAIFRLCGNFPDEAPHLLALIAKLERQRVVHMRSKSR